MSKKRTAAPCRRQEPPAATAPSDTMTLSASASKLIAEVTSQWDISPPVRELLRLVGEAMTKAEQCERITAAEGLVIGDQKGSAKPHPAALLARDYRAQASGGLQRILAHLER